jgi:peptidyl-prolyl cis-trans isomerase A (cyclophilin A)
MKIATGALLALLLAAAPLVSAGLSKVVIKTDLGDIAVEIDSAKAPITAANFFRYVDAGLYDGTVFHRTVNLSSPRNKPVPIEVIQGGRMPDGVKEFPPISLERTSATGLRHLDGTISMARSGPDTATSSFFFCVGPQPELDFGGKRNKDGQGFAAFGRIVSGMEVVRRIHKSPADDQESLTPPVKIISIRRLGE